MYATLEPDRPPLVEDYWKELNVKCANCRYLKGEHQAVSLHCLLRRVDGWEVFDVGRVFRAVQEQTL
jgi:hypothetical protein